MYVDFYKEQIAADLYSDRELSALINNNNLLREYVESITDLLDSDLTDDQIIDMNELLSTVTAPLVDLNSTTAHALSSLIIGDVDAANVGERRGVDSRCWRTRASRTSGCSRRKPKVF